MLFIIPFCPFDILIGELKVACRRLSDCGYSGCFSVVISSGTFAHDALRRIQDVQIRTFDDVIRIHEDLCTVVFNTVSAYSVWFVLHWFTYGAGIVVAVIYTEEEVISRTKYHTQTPEFVFLGLLFVSVLYLFVFPCVCAARITSNCAGKITDAKNNTPHQLHVPKSPR